MTQTQAVLDLLGLSVADMAMKLKHRHETTVRYWMRTGRIPHWRHPSIFALAEKRKIPRAKIARLLNGGGR